MWACERGLHILVDAVLTKPEHHRWVHDVDVYAGRTPLMLASWYGRTQTVQVLMQRCRDTIEVNKAANNGSTAVYFGVGGEPRGCIGCLVAFQSKSRQGTK